MLKASSRPVGKHSPPQPPEVTSVRWVPYVPETDRYGGPKALPVCEQFFHCSSVTALNLLRDGGNPHRAARLGRALSAMAILAHNVLLSKRAVIDLLQVYEAGYLATVAPGKASVDLSRSFRRSFSGQESAVTTQVHGLWRILEAGDRLPEPLNRYSQAATALAIELGALFAAGELTILGNPETEWNRSSFRIVASLLHMMNNRLGISIVEESYLAHVLRATLDS